jgi:hypothetical protein
MFSCDGYSRIRTRRDRTLGVLIIGLTLTTVLSAQENQAREHVPHYSTAEAKAQSSAKPKLTPRQRQGLQLLRGARVEAAALRVEVRAYVLWQSSRGYAKVSPGKIDPTLRNSFSASQSVENAPTDQEQCSDMPQVCDLKGWLQRKILTEIVHRTPDKVEDLLPAAEPGVREDILTVLIDQYAQQGDLDRARKLLNQFADDYRYPYGAASRVMELLPVEKAADRLAIFIQASRNFHQHSGTSKPQFEDFTTMVVRFWQQVSPPLVMDAIDAILEQAQNADGFGSDVNISVSAKAGVVQFANSYQYRLFEVLPIIQQLDPSRAESLLRENSEVQSALNSYPDGLRSLAPGAYSGQSSSRVGIQAISYRPSGSNSIDTAVQRAQVQMEFDVDRRAQQIAEAASLDPKQALADAMGLPQAGISGSDSSSPRLRALEGLAGNAVRNAPEVARSALEEELKLVDGASPTEQGFALDQVATVYLQLGDPDNARKIIQRELKVADNLYVKDADAGDPNQAFKAWWPSTSLWRKTITTAAKISPALASEVIAGIADPEIRVLEEVELANSLLGVMSFSYEQIEWHKNGISGAM